MGIPRVNDCCFVLDLKLGCIIIGVICVVIGILFAANEQLGDDNRGNTAKLTGTVAAILYIVTGALILAGVLLGMGILVQVGAIVLLVVWIVNFVVAVLAFIDNGKPVPIIIDLLLLVLVIYFCLVLWSFAT